MHVNMQSDVVTVERLRTLPLEEGEAIFMLVDQLKFPRPYGARCSSEHQRRAIGQAPLWGRGAGATTYSAHGGVRAAVLALHGWRLEWVLFEC